MSENILRKEFEDKTGKSVMLRNIHLLSPNASWIQEGSKFNGTYVRSVEVEVLALRAKIAELKLENKKLKRLEGKE